MSCVYVNSDPKTAANARISKKTIPVLLQLYYRINKLNYVDKSAFQKRMDWIKDYRTWKKYWAELLDKEVIVFLDQDTIMVSPYECYQEGVSQETLINQWESIRRN